jgi:hypothetical protein
MGSQSYKDLLVWQKSLTLCTLVYTNDIIEIRKMIYALRGAGLKRRI